MLTVGKSRRTSFRSPGISVSVRSDASLTATGPRVTGLERCAAQDGEESSTRRKTLLSSFS
jgi:hypothetical protein